MIPVEHHHNNTARSYQEWSWPAYRSDPPRHYRSVPRLLLKPVDRRDLLYICSGSCQAGFPCVLLAYFRSLEYEAANKDSGRSSYVLVRCKGMYICKSLAVDFWANAFADCGEFIALHTYSSLLGQNDIREMPH
jgi:hypothetical protein